MARILLLVLFLAASGLACAEEILGIKPGTSLAALREQFPNATLVDQKPAWATRGQKLFELKGNGLGGIVMIKFDDIRPALNAMLGESNTDPEDENFFIASGFRIVPANPLPLNALVEKYGKPEQTGVDSSYHQYVSWPSKGVSATLARNSQIVIVVEHVYSAEELAR